jgi:hypothetical protein
VNISVFKQVWFMVYNAIFNNVSVIFRGGQFYWPLVFKQEFMTG